MNKVSVLYHASTKRDIEKFEPRNESPRYPKEEPLIFATPDKRVAAMFLAPKDGGSAEICKFGDRTILVVQNSPEDFLAHDKGGAIYTLPIETFSTDETIGMKRTEWVSKVPVVPLNKEIFETSIEAMKQYHVELYFVDEDTMSAIRDASDHGLNIINSLEPYYT